MKNMPIMIETSFIFVFKLKEMVQAKNIKTYPCYPWLQKSSCEYTILVELFIHVILMVIYDFSFSSSFPANQSTVSLGCLCACLLQHSSSKQQSIIEHVA